MILALCLETVLLSHSAAHILVVVGHGTDQERLVIRTFFTDGVMEVQKKIVYECFRFYTRAVFRQSSPVTSFKTNFLCLNDVT